MKRNSAWIAAVLSFVFPGLGHLYLGRRRAAVVFGLPAVVTAVALGLEALSGLESFLGYLITPSGSMTVLIFFLVSGLWRALAIVNSVLVARRGGDRHVMAGALAATVCLAFVLGMHGASAYYAFAVYDASSQIFVGDGPDKAQATATAPGGSPGGIDSGLPTGSMSSDDPGQSGEYAATPYATPPSASSRVNILITGIDAAPTRSEALNDTLMVVSVNPADGSVDMLSVPRDVSNFPLYSGGTFNGKINSLMTYALLHPKEFPDGPLTTLEKEIGYLLGVPIHYYAAVNLDGFRRMIDLVGGVTVVNPAPIDDPKYDWLDGSPYGLQMPAGQLNLNGRMALAFVRSRQGAGDNDFTRARRQQLLLLALRDKLTSPAMLPNLPGILKIASQTIRTDVPASRLDEFITMARNVDPNKVERFVLGQPYASSSMINGTYTLELNMDKIAKLSIRLFGQDSRYASGN